MKRNIRVVVMLAGACIVFVTTGVHHWIMRNCSARQTGDVLPFMTRARDWAPISAMNNNTPVGNGTPQRKLPQVIGIGVKKCGTGALRNFLAKHPKVKISPTETHFFDENSTFKKGKKKYISMMPVASGDEQTMEITPKYFVTDYVPGRMKSLYGQMAKRLKFIVIICNPIDRLFSEYVHSRSSALRFDVQKRLRNYESVSDMVRTILPNLTSELRKLWNSSTIHESKAFSEFITSSIEAKLITNGIYVMHLKHWLTHFSPTQILAVNGDSLITKPWVVLNRVQNFLGLEGTIAKDDFRFDKEKGFYCIGECLHDGKGRTRSQNKSKKMPFRPLTKSARQALQEIYRPYNKELFMMLNRTLHW